MVTANTTEIETSNCLEMNWHLSVVLVWMLAVFPCSLLFLWYVKRVSSFAWLDAGLQPLNLVQRCVLLSDHCNGQSLSTMSLVASSWSIFMHYSQCSWVLSSKFYVFFFQNPQNLCIFHFSVQYSLCIIVVEVDLAVVLLKAFLLPH